MTYSRTRTHQKSRKRRYRKWLLINLTLLVLILAVGGLLVAKLTSPDGKAAISGTQSEPPAATSSAPSASASPEDDAAAASDDSTESGDKGDSDEPSDIGASDDLDSSSGANASDEPAGGPAAGGVTGDRVTLAFVGDILPASTVGSLMDKNGVDYPFANAAATLQAADIAAGNLETPITERGTPAENKTYVFRGKPEYLTGIKNAGFDVLTLANNHTLDQGWEGLSDTMNSLDDAKLKHMGSGTDAQEAFTPVIMEANGIRVAYIGVTNVVPDGTWKAGKNHPGVADCYDTRPAVAAIQAAKKLADVVVVMVHWGNERQQQPKQAQFDVGHAFIDAGADLVIGSHPHVLQGFEYYKGKWIAYSLGNFVFTSNGNTLTQKTGILTATCGKNGSCGMNFEPMFSQYSQPSPMEPADGALLLAELSNLSYGAEVDDKGEIIPASSGGGKETP